jgi:hypothetical protein
VFRRLVSLQHLGVVGSQQERRSRARHYRLDLPIPIRTPRYRCGEHSVLFERYAERPLARLVGNVRKWWSGKRGGKHRRRVASGKAYKTIEGNL